jgi:phospholipase/carboxylesterase
MLVLHAGLRRPAAPRAILAFSGALLAPEALAQERTNAAPVLLIHGDADPVVPVQASRQAEQVLLDAGVLVETLYRPGIGHAIDEAGIAAAALFLQRAFSMNMTER